jgi:hypothetical protein
MRTQGYMTQEQLGGPLSHEMRVYIDEEGELCHDTATANHRILMAELAGVRRVPFVLLGAHGDWISRLCRASGHPPHVAFRAWRDEHQIYASTFRGERPARTPGRRRPLDEPDEQAG